ncbi:hypothetical protein [Cryptosporangium aurantiacum]|uniref:Uncharacterized protein n=1 Tax=Cryptosporangium aurantiacum TaxID=134849 RepID=A0A1M7RP99_9ACTN|nr:hypothetical protein [Cryptosporangium aurantiacum]SHN47888.1 hypothetical protein SAMN05443668_12948 [Cryptosporangium aurantiacum]
MSETAEALERRIDDLRAAVRRAVTAGDRSRAQTLRAELRRAEREWDMALDALAPPSEPDPDEPPPADHRAAAALLPLREQVHQALTMLGAPAAPKLIVQVHEAFSTGEMTSARLTSLRRDEERSFRSAPHARPYYLCAALTADLLAPARGLLAVSTWSMSTRIIGPLSPRVDFLTAAARLAEEIQRLADPGAAARRLLWRFAANIPGAGTGPDRMTPEAVAAAARAELALHQDADQRHRDSAARRARDQLDEVQQLFGSRFVTVAGGAGSG